MDNSNNVNTKLSQYDFMYESSKKYSGKVALSYQVPDVGKTIDITYEEMYEKIDQYARALTKYGIKRGDKVATCLFNTPESVYLIYALNKIGVTNIGLSPLVNSEGMTEDLLMTKPDVIITMDTFYPLFKGENTQQFNGLVFTPVDSYNGLIRAGYNLKVSKKMGIDKKSKLSYVLDKGKNFEFSDYGLTAPDFTSDVLFTSGSTGIHKGVELTNENFNESVVGMTEIYKGYISPWKTHLIQIPIGHMTYGRAILHYALSQGMKAALSLKPAPDDFYDELMRTKANDCAGGPPHFRSLIMEQDGKLIINPKLVKGSLSELKFATSGGEEQRIRDLDAINSAFEYCGSTAKLGNGLGATEATGPFIVNNGSKGYKAILGVPIPSLRTKLVNPETNEINDREGELHISGPVVMKGYYNNQEETDKVLYYDEDGTRWFKTGDIVSRDGDKYSYVSRLKRNYVCDITNVYPEQIESVLESIPEIREAVVVPVPDNERQFVSKYYISLFDINSATKEFEDRICSIIEKKLHVSYLPGYIEYTDKPLVRNGSTKKDIKFYRQDALKELEKAKQKKLQGFHGEN